MVVTQPCRMRREKLIVGGGSRVGHEPMLNQRGCLSFPRRHMGRAQNRKGFGWKRWSRRWLYETLRLFHGYRVRRSMPKVALAG
jgi:hypothetical protein